MTAAKRSDLGERRDASGEAGDTTLRRLVADPESFASTMWGARACRHHHPAGFRDLLSIEAVDQLLESARRPGFRVVNEGRTISPTEYTTTVRMGGTSLDDAANPAKIGDLFRDGATVVLQGLERSHPALRQFARQLAAELSNPVQANAYLSPGGGARGLTRHADVHDVFVLQVEGSKHWDVDGIGRVQLVAGDVLYMPRGTMHIAETGGQASLHVTIGVRAATYRDVLSRMIERLATETVGDENSVLDRWLPIGYARSEAAAGELRAGIELAVAEAMIRLEHVKPLEVVEREQRRVERRLRRTSSLRPAFDAAALTLDTPVRTVDGRPIELGSEGEQVVIDLDDRRIRMPLAALPALRHLVDRGTATPGELPDLSDHSRMVVVRRLIKEGALELVRPDSDDAED